MSMMKPYHDLVEQVLREGIWQENRTGVRTKMIAGAMLKFNLEDGRFPALTTRKVAFKATRGELLGFLRGYQSAADFRALGCGFWDANANETSAWVNNPARRGVDDLGKIYGAIWNDWEDWREMNVPVATQRMASMIREGYGDDDVRHTQAFRDAEVYIGKVQGRGYKIVAVEGDKVIVRRSINQVESVLRTLLTNPYDRRMLISGWRPELMDLQALPSCHYSYQFIAEPTTGRLHVVMTMRSADLAAGVTHNIISTALFLHIMGAYSGFKPATVTVSLGDAHIYENHVDGLRQMLAREHLQAPHLALDTTVLHKLKLEEVEGAFCRVQPAHLEMVNYDCHPAIKMPMAA